MCQSTESCRDFKEALQALSLRGSECGVKISKAHTAVVNDRAAGKGQTESLNFLEDDATPARLLGFLFVCFCFALVLCSLEKPCRRQFDNDPLTYKLSGAIEVFSMVGQFRLQM